MIRVEKYNSIHEIDASRWDSILNNNDIYHKYNFIRIVEDSKVENADFAYMIFYDNDKLIATTVFSIFSISLDLFISNSKFVKKLKNLFPKLFSIKILVCGLPASFGQQNLKLADDKYAEEITHLVADEMYAIAAKQKIKFLTIKEFEEEEVKLFEGFEKKGFFRTNSIPYMHMDIEWKNFEEYLSSLRHHYRRKIILSLKKTGHAAPAIIPLEQYEGNTDTAAWVLAEPGDDFANDFFPKYLSVMERTPVKLETLNREFFENMQKQKGEYKLLHFIVKGKLISTAILIFSGDTLTFMLVGRENEKDEYDSYFNLVYGIIAVAIQSGIKKLKLGQTAYWVKQCVGGIPENEFIYFASKRPVTHWLLKKFRNAIFPEMRLKPLHIFHERSKTAEIQKV